MEKLQRRWNIFKALTRGNVSMREFALLSLPSWRYAESKDIAQLRYDIEVCDQYKARDFLKKDSIIIDAGANIGTFSRFAAELAPEGRIYAFEPRPDIFKRIPVMHNIFPYQVALGEKTGEGILHISKELGGNALDDSFLKVDGRKITVQVVSLDEFIDSRDIPRIDFIKIDTEGYEVPILKGAQKAIKKFHPIISMSAYHATDDPERLKNIVLDIDSSYQFSLERRSELDLICF